MGSNPDFKIIECALEKIIVNRPPQNMEEETMMRLAVQDAITRLLISSNNEQIEYKKLEDLKGANHGIK